MSVQNSRKTFLDVKPQPAVKSTPTAAPAPNPAPAARTFANEFSSGRSSALKAKALGITGAKLNTAPTIDGGGGGTWPRGPLAPSQTPNPQVDVMQQRLISLGYLTAEQIGTSQGVYGNRTTAAVQQFQIANDLHPANGLADEATLAAMGRSSALSMEEALSELSGTALGQPIGTAGEGEVPTLSTLEQPPPTGVITASGSANLRPDPSTTGAAVASLPNGTPVAITAPQPEGRAGWLHVSAEVDGRTVSGWVSNGAPDLVNETAISGDPRVNDRLAELGYVPPDAAQTPEAISNFQLMNGLEATGTLDDATLAAMWSADAVMSSHLVQVKDPDYNHSSDAPSRSNNCGPASTAMALAAVGLAPIDNADPQGAIDATRDAMGGNSATRTGPTHLEKAITAAGGESYRVNTTDEVKLALANGDPVVLFGNTYGGHWVTVLGFDPKTETWLVSDPMNKGGVAQWSQADYDAYVNYSVDSVAVRDPNA